MKKLNSLIVCNIYSPVRSLAAEQEVYYERVGKVIEELEIKYINREPGLIILGDFNLPLEQNMNKNIAEQIELKIYLNILLLLV